MVVGSQALDGEPSRSGKQTPHSGEQLLKEAERNAKLGSWRLDLVENTHQWSDELFRIFDLPSTTTPSFEAFLECVHPEDREHTRASFAQAITSGVTRDEVEYRTVRRNGDVRHILTVSTFVRSDSGRAVSMYGTAQDITEWRMTERALRQSEAHLSSILDTATDIVASLDLEGTILYINHVVAGLDRDQVIGTSAFDYLPPDGQVIFRDAMEQVRSTCAPYQYEIEGAGPKGQMAWYSCRLGPVLRDDQVVGLTLLTSDISKQRKGEAALRESEQFFRSVFEQAAVSVALIETKTGRFVRVNNKCAEFSGHTVEELQEMTFMDISHPDELPENLENLRRLHAGEIREFSMEKRLVHSDGTVNWYYLTVSPTWDPGDEPRYHIAIVQDISARKRAELQILASERKYRQLIETTQEGVWVIDAEGTTTFVNERLAEMLGYSTGEMLGHSIFDFMDDVANADAQRNLERRRQGIKEQHDFRLRCKDGTALWTSMSTNPLLDEDGKHSGALAMVTDITARKRMESELKDSRDQLEVRVKERTSELSATNQRLQDEIAARKRIDEERGRLSSIIEATPDFVGFADLQGRVRYVNQSARRALGYADDAPIDHLHLRDFHPESAVKLLLEKAFPATIRDGSWRGEVPWLSRDGREIPTAMVLQAHYTSKGDVDLLSTIAHDISDLRGAQQALQRAERLASIGTLAAGIAHEINNPLGAMLLTTEYALRKLDDREILEDSLKNILSHVERCARIVRSVLQFSRDGYSKKSRHDLLEILRRALDLTRPQAQQADIQVQLSEAVDKCFANINPLEMEQVFVNLLANAVQSSKRGSQVLVKLNTADGRVRVVIEDHGAGMSREILARMFDPFFTTRLHGGGTGLGLSIVHGIVRDHGGSIDVWSEPNQGTRVTISLPMTQQIQPNAQSSHRR
ncbi:MAG: PAS domain S-box protein [Planctomycetaceae bacterium]|nr:PAS domain S-box protein [Planctomycetaceae bacterium]